MSPPVLGLGAHFDGLILEPCASCPLLPNTPLGISWSISQIASKAHAMVLETIQTSSVMIV